MACNPYWNDAVFVCPFSGTNGSTSFVDLKGNTITTHGSAHISTDQSIVGSSSGLFGPTNDYLTFPYSGNFNFPGDFHLRIFVYPVAHTYSYPCIFSNYSAYAANGGLAVFAGHNGGASNKYQVSYNGTFPVLTSTSSIAYNTWSVLDIGRVGSTLYLRVNGNLEATATGTATIAGTSDNIWVAAAGDALSSSTFHGYIGGVFIGKGIGGDIGGDISFLTNQCAISGGVKNASGSPISRLVRAYRRDTGALVGSGISNGTTGAYNIPVQYSDECYVVRVDDTTDPPTAGTENALIFDRVIPV